MPGVHLDLEEVGRRLAVIREREALIHSEIADIQREHDAVEHFVKSHRDGLRQSFLDRQENEQAQRLRDIEKLFEQIHFLHDSRRVLVEPRK